MILALSTVHAKILTLHQYRAISNKITFAAINLTVTPTLTGLETRDLPHPITLAQQLM
jgi:hypothetical protein